MPLPQQALAELGMDAKTISAGFLHDVLEDTKVTEAELKKEFATKLSLW